MKRLLLILDEKVHKTLETIKNNSKLTWEQIIISALIEYGVKHKKA